MRRSLYAIIFLIAATSSSIHAQEQTQEDVTSRNQAVEKFANLLTIIDYAYVDTVNNSKMVEDAINGILKNLDPHSVYIPKKDLEKMREPLEGNFDGIGIRFNIFHDTILVVSPISGGPSEKLGIQSGDRIVTIEGENVAGNGVTNNDVQKKLRGKKGIVVNIQIERHGEKKLLDFAITRDEIPLYSVDASYMASPGIGYIKVSRFARNTMQEFNQALDTLERDGAKSLILDLRGNGGGYLRTAINLADEFLPTGKMIVYTKGDKQKEVAYKATTKGSFEGGNLIVLINEGSASASEIVSGAMQDWDRALVIGRRSFGKGLVQKPYPLPDGSAVRLTTAHYYTPTGRCIQRPYNKGKKDYYNEINKRYKSGQLFNADSIHFPDSLKFYTPNKRVVYGGGGIMPDIFVPIDTTLNSDLNKNLIRKGVYNEFINTFLDKNRKKYLKEYPSFKDYEANFSVDDAILNYFFKIADKKGVEKNDEEYEKSKNLIDTQIKALLARDLYSTSAYFKIINKLSNAYIEAINLLGNEDEMKVKLAHD